MLYIIQIILTILFSIILKNFFPWWYIAIAAFLAQFSNNLKKYKIFLGGFTSIASLWLFKITLIDITTNSIISSKVSSLFGFRNHLLLILLSGFVGGIIGGFSALTGSYFKEIFFKKPEEARKEIL